MWSSNAVNECGRRMWSLNVVDVTTDMTRSVLFQSMSRNLALREMTDASKNDEGLL